MQNLAWKIETIEFSEGERGSTTSTGPKFLCESRSRKESFPMTSPKPTIEFYSTEDGGSGLNRA